MQFMEALIKFLRNQFRVGYFNGKLLNPKEVSDPIVWAIKSIPDTTTIKNPEEISSGIIEAQKETTQAVQGITFPEQKELDLKPLYAKFDELKSAIDTKGIISSVERLQKAVEVSKETIEPQEVIDYTELIVEVIKNLEKPGYDYSKIEEILNVISKKEFILPLDEKGRVKVSVDKVSMGGRGSLSSTESAKLLTLATEEKQDALIAQTLGDKPLSGASANGTVALTSANTWYAVPSGTPPATPYVLVTSLENAAGTVRFGFANTSTPSVTNGNLADGTITLRLAGGQVVYFGSSTAGDDVNFSTKII